MKNQLLSEWVKNARTSASLSQEQLGEKVGRTKQNVYSWEKGIHEPSADQIREIMKATGAPAPDKYMEIAGVSASNIIPFGQPVKSLKDDEEVPKGYYAVKQYEIRLSCGTGNDIEYDESETTPRIYHESFFKRKKVDPADVIRVECEGHSMKPVIKHGYRTAIHTKSTTIPVVSAEDAKDEDNLTIFFLLDDGCRKCKYVYIEKESGDVVLHSQNPTFKDQRYQQEYANDYLKIIGKVIDISGDPNE